MCYWFENAAVQLTFRMRWSSGGGRCLPLLESTGRKFLVWPPRFTGCQRNGFSRKWTRSNRMSVVLLCTPSTPPPPPPRVSCVGCFCLVVVFSPPAICVFVSHCILSPTLSIPGPVFFCLSSPSSHLYPFLFFVDTQTRLSAAGCWWFDEAWPDE